MGALHGAISPGEHDPKIGWLDHSHFLSYNRSRPLGCIILSYFNGGRWSATCHGHYNKAQLTQGLRAIAPSFQDGRQLPSWSGYYRTGNSTIRSADVEKPSLPNMEWIGCTVCEISAFKLYCDLETGVRGHSRSSKAAPLYRPTPKT